MGDNTEAGIPPTPQQHHDPPTEPTTSGRQTYEDLAWLPILGYLVVFPLTIGVYSFVSTAPYPLTVMGSIEAVVGLIYAIYGWRDLGQVDFGRERYVWFAVLIISGATVVAAPLGVALYLRRRRSISGEPSQSWLSIIRR